MPLICDHGSWLVAWRRVLPVVGFLNVLVSIFVPYLEIIKSKNSILVAIHLIGKVDVPVIFIEIQTKPSKLIWAAPLHHQQRTHKTTCSAKAGMCVYFLFLPPA